MSDAVVQHVVARHWHWDTCSKAGITAKCVERSILNIISEFVAVHLGLNLVIMFEEKAWTIGSSLRCKTLGPVPVPCCGKTDRVVMSRMTMVGFKTLITLRLRRISSKILRKM